MYVVLTTDFAQCNRVIGPFRDAQEAHNWAFQNLPEVYRVFPLNPPNGEATNNQPLFSQGETG